MALTNCYCTLAQLQARMDIDDTVDDVILEHVITGVSRMIDQHCRRRFYAATETRYYTPKQHQWCVVDDLLSVTTLATDDDGGRTWATTWASTDYELVPSNAVVDGQPYTAIETSPNGTYWFPLINRGLKIAGSFGYATTTPAVIREACLIQAARIFKRKDSPFGVAGVGELGVMRISALDPDVKMLLHPMIRYGYGGNL
jgi:hypothetical protein